MMDFELLPRTKCQELFEAAQAAAKRAGVPDIEVTLAASGESLTRFANNEIHQNVSERTRSMSIRALWNQRTARVTTNRLHRDGVQGAVDEAIALVKQSEPDPDLLPLYAGDASPESHRYVASIAGCTPQDRALAVREVIAIVESEHQVAAGIYSTGHMVEAILNSSGLSRYFGESLAIFSVTATAADSSGWAKASTWNGDHFNIPDLARTAVRKATLSRDPREASPGRYMVVLEPAAVLDLVGQIFGDFSGTALADQRSFLTGRMGEKIFGDNIQITDDVRHPFQAGAPFDSEGVGRMALTLVQNGAAREVAYSRSAAAKAGMAPTGHGFHVPNDLGEAPVNIVIAGEDRSVDDLVASTTDGILVTRLWYIREVEPYEKIMTGMTRDGTFLVKNGEIAYALKNFRFNQSVIDLLRNVQEMSRSVRASGEEAIDMVVPGMKVHDFHFTERTTF